MKNEQTAAIETLKAMRGRLTKDIDELYSPGSIASEYATLDRNALTTVLAMVEQAEEIFEAATEIWFGYGRPAKMIERQPEYGQWENEGTGKTFDSVQSAYAAIKEQTK